MLRRLLPVRWARIATWTGAAIAWCVSLIGMQTVSTSGTDAAVAAPGTEDGTSVATPAPQQVDTLPASPEDGLLIVRFTPQAPPPPVTRTAVGGGGTGGGGGFNPTPIPKVTSRGS